MLSTLLPNFLIGLREGLEAALVVSILIAFLVKAGRQDRLPLVWLGVGIAIVVSAIFGASLTFIWDNVDSFYTQELMGGVLSIVAVAFVTWMIFWMRRTARFLKKELSDKLADALGLGPVAIVVAAFLAVAREGLETTLFFWSASRSAGETSTPLAGFVLGIAVAIVLGWLIYRSAIKINLSKFFTYTGIGLILVAGGILGYGIYDLQEIEILPGLYTYAFDISERYDAASWYGTLLKGIFNFQPNTTVLQAIAWTLYVGGVLTAFLWPQKSGKPPAKSAAKSAVSTEEASESRPAVTTETVTQPAEQPATAK